MSEGFAEGLKGAILGVTVSLVISAILLAIPSPYKEIIKIGNLVQGIAVLESFEHMGTGYLLGWLLGSILMWRVGLLEDLFGVSYTIVGSLMLVEKIARKLG